MTFVPRNSGYDTFLNANMCTNRSSDVKTDVKELIFFKSKSALKPSNRKYIIIARGNSKMCLSIGPPLQSILAVTKWSCDREWSSGHQIIVTDHAMIMQSNSEALNFDFV